MDSGRTRLLLNGKSVFQADSLDQGFRPSGVYTSPTDKAQLFDITEMMRFGINIVRKHVKIKPVCWNYWCNKPGLLIWQDMLSRGGGKDGKAECKGEPSEFAPQFETELRALVKQHPKSPSIVMWVVFNEDWWRCDATRLTPCGIALDPSRVVNRASCPDPDNSRTAVLGEFGRLGLAIPNPNLVESAWGYRGVTGERSVCRVPA